MSVYGGIREREREREVYFIVKLHWGSSQEFVRKNPAS